MFGLTWTTLSKAAFPPLKFSDLLIRNEPCTVNTSENCRRVDGGVRFAKALWKMVIIWRLLMAHRVCWQDCSCSRPVAALGVIGFCASFRRMLRIHQGFIALPILDEKMTRATSGMMLVLLSCEVRSRYLYVWSVNWCCPDSARFA